MNAKGLTQPNPAKKVLSSKTENGTEVFVLPPDLLQKLGIHLGGAPTFPGPPTESPSGFTNSVNSRKSDETILETAKLMKKSVFLSPTFIPTESHITEEVEITNIVDEKYETNTLIVQEVGLMDSKEINLEPENIDPIIVNITENNSNIADENNCNYKSEEIIIHVKTSTTNTISFSEINQISCKSHINIIPSCENTEISQNTFSGCTCDENISNNIKESSIETSVEQTHDGDVVMHVENKNTSKASNSAEILSGMSSQDINEKIFNTTHISQTNSLIKKEHKTPIKINIISEEKLDSSNLRDLKSLNSPNRATLTPIIIKSVVNGRKINENSIENADGSYLKVEVNEEMENLKGTEFTTLVKDYPISKSSMNLNLSSMNSDPKENISNNIFSPMKNEATLMSSLQNKNNNLELQPSSDVIADNDETDVNMKKEICLNFNSNLDSNIILSENLKFSYETQDADKEDGKLKIPKTNHIEKYFTSECVNTFDGSYIKQQLNKIENVETTAIDKECVNHNKTCDSEFHNQNTQNTFEQVCTSSSLLYKDKDCEIDTENNIKSEIFLNNLDISAGKNSDMKLDSTKFIHQVIENDKVIKNIFPLNIMKEPTTNPNVSSTNSKSCIQGVEKPGGDQNNFDFYYNIPKVLKTYKKRIKVEKPLKDNFNCLESKGVLKLPEFVEQNENRDSIENQEFCVCWDFGKLNYYENDSLYEHIHFWKNNVSEKNSELIYSIYYDQDYIKYCSKLEEKHSNDSCCSEQNSNNMCWNYYKMDVQKHITEFNFNIGDLDKLKHDDISKSIKSENCALDSAIVALDIEDDERNINYQIKMSDQNNKSNEIIDIKYKKLNDICNQNKKTKRKLNTDSRQNFIITSSGEQSNHVNTEIDTASSKERDKLKNIYDRLKTENASNVALDISNEKPENECDMSESKNFRSTISKNIKCGICKLLLSEIEWEDHISNVHCYIAWKDGHIIDLDDKELLRKLSQKLKTEGVLDCKFCEIKFKEVKLLISHLKACMESFISNTDSSNVKKHTKCGVCQEKVEITNWINHIAEEHNYMAWNDLECILDLQNENKVKEHLNKISKQCKGLICSKCKVIYKYVNSYLKHIKKCDGIEDNKGDISSNDQSILNTSLETNVTKEGLRNKRKIDINVLQSTLKDDMRNTDNDIEVMKKKSSVNIGSSSIISTTNKINDQEVLYENKGNEIAYKLVVAKNNEIVNNKTHPIKDVKSKSDKDTVDIANLSKTASAMSTVGATASFKMQNKKTKQNSKSPLKEAHMIKDEIVFKDECVENSLNSNQCRNNNNKVPIKDYDEIAKEANIKIEKEQQSNEDNSRNSDVIIRKSKKNKGLPVKQSKGKSECISEASISPPNEDVGLTVQTEKRNKVSEASVLPEETMSTKCGVCLKEITSSAWFDHISKEHNYLAWEEGTSPIDLNEEYDVEQHLRKMLKQYGELLCMKCGCRRKYVKPYMSHIKSCEMLPNDDGEVSDSTVDNNISETNTTLNTSSLNESLDERVISCGVCHQEMKSQDWLDHIQKSHNYLAWIEGDKVLDTNDAEEIQKHLMAISKRSGGLKCSKCGLVRKYIKTFLQHIRSCKQYTSESDDSDTPLVKNKAALVQCGVCFEEVESKNWKQHAMNKHYNVAWVLGDTPIDLKNFYAVDKYLKEYKNKFNNLICKVCRISRVSCYGFYAHILFCGKTEEESEKFKELCEICNNKYICIYKHQHMAMHREQVYAKERKLKLAEQREKELESSNTDTPGRRRAAEKAKNVIAKYKANLIGGRGVCKKCGFEADSEGDSAQHNCPKANDDCSSDSDVSVKLEQYSEEEEEESNDTDLDSDVSNNEIQNEKKKRRHGDVGSTAVKVPRLPYSVKNVGSYIQQSYIDFCQTHLTSDTLFPQWRRRDYEVVSDEEIQNYMPPLKESCKMKFINDEWETYHRFQASVREENHVVFVGGPIQCIAWAPGPVDDVEYISRNYLAVASYSGSDCPRSNCDETPQHSNLIQIWDFGDTVSSVPKFEYGIAHDYGTVWAMDWCPSGARDCPLVKSDGCESTESNRLGLLAIACSSGSVYIFSVPYPSTTTQMEKPFYKMKPVAELRFSTSSDKRKGQATSLSWSSQNGHAVIIVGYSDGIIAFYDLNSDSPFLKALENDVTIVYPYHDERSHNTCVTGVGSYAGGTDVSSGAAWSSASCSGARAFTGLPGRTTVVHTHLASTAAMFTPHWPSVQLTGDSYINNLNQTVNELEWVGGGRRVGGALSWCACARCGLSAAAALPLIRVLRAHPAYTEIKKQIIGSLEMSPIGQKRKQQGNDELAIKLEPFNYEDAVKKYGLEFKLIPGKNKAAQQKASLIPSTAYPERYPLADVTCMAFCPSAKCHNKLAIATHAGIILYINV